MPDPTSNYGWDLPNVLGDSGAWGTLLNTILDEIDVELGAALDADTPGIRAVAEAALPRAGGSMSGEIDILTARYTAVDLGSDLTGTATMDLDAGNFFYGVMGGSVTLAFSNVPASGDFVGVVLEITGVTGGTLSWPASVTWPNGLPPSNPGDGEVNVYTLYTRDGGTTWRAARAMEDSS